MQNNLKELFTLLEYLDPGKYSDTDSLQSKYEELDQQKVNELHELLKPYILRRIKEEVLKNLPPKVLYF